MRLTYKILILPCISVLILTCASLLLLFWQYPQFPEDGSHVIFLRLLWGEIVVGILVLIATAWLAWRLTKTLTASIMDLATTAKDIARGNLSEASTRIASLAPLSKNQESPKIVDETQRLLHAIAEMTENLNSLVGQVQLSGVQVAAASSQLFATAQWQESTVTRQMGSMKDVRTSMDDVFRITTSLAESVHQVAAMSQETADVANSGHTDLVRMKDAMSRMEVASGMISDRLEAINQKTDAITTIVTTITKVSEQTNLLSLNAAIEAEKAGEYGRGFSVIAREIRRLADQTAVATLDIDRMVKEMESTVAGGVMEMDKFIAEMRYSVNDISRIGSQMTSIIEHVQALSPNFENVNGAMEQQSQNARRIMAEIIDLGEDMQRTREALQESYAALEQLTDAAQNLQTEVSRFQVKTSILQEIDIFQAFSEDAREYLDQHMQPHRFSPGEELIHEGDTTDSLFIIAKGVVSIQIQVADGKMLEVARRAVRDFLGEFSLLTGEPRSASVIALTECNAYEIKKEDIAPFIEQEPRIAERLSAILTERRMDTETKKNRYEAHKLDRDTLYAQTLQKIQQFFGLQND
jgi:methyl-accepting chemotaxis protein/CRP-like cAMP-binding protein